MRLGARRFDFDREIAVMSIVNRTPDSFYDHGTAFALDDALRHVEAQMAAGADIVDVGGIRAGPGADVSEDEEVRRVVPFVEAFRRRWATPLSVDTSRPGVARAALDAGADLINDVTGLRDPGLADVVAAHPGAALVVTHHGGPPRSRPHRPDYDADVVGAARHRCARLAAAAMARGVARDQIAVDPGHDMFKTTAQSLELTRRIDELAALGFPVLIALSNKDFVGEALGRDLGQRGAGSLAAAVVAVLRGARIVRAHDAAATVDAMRMVEVILGWRPAATMLRGLD